MVLNVYTIYLYVGTKDMSMLYEQTTLSEQLTSGVGPRNTRASKYDLTSFVGIL